jgi:hypothetical protein
VLYIICFVFYIVMLCISILSGLAHTAIDDKSIVDSSSSISISSSSSSVTGRVFLPWNGEEVIS